MSFVKVLNAQFVRNGVRIEGFGGNKYQLHVNTMSESDMRLLFAEAQEIKIPVIRTWAFDAGDPTSDSAGNFRYLDYPVGTNILANGSFETVTAPWVVGADWSRVSTDFHDGGWGMKQVSSSGYSSFYQAVTVLPSTNYVLTYWYKVSNPSGNPPVTFIGTSPGNNNVKDGGYNYDTAGVWERKQIFFNSGANTTLYVTFQNYNGSVTQYLDEINLSVQGTPTLVYREETFEHFDLMTALAEEYNVMLQPVYADNPHYNTKKTYVNWANSVYGAGLSTAFPYIGFWTDPYCKYLYKQFFYTLMNRVNTVNGRIYKNNPYIFAHEMGNELRYDVNDSEGGTQHTINSTNIATVKAWMEEMGAYMKSVAPNHLVTFGDCAHTWQWVNGDTVSNGSGYGVDYNMWAASPYIDFLQFHTYPTQGGSDSELNKFGQRLGYPNEITGNGYRAQLRDFVNVAKANGKPAVIGEVGFSREIVRSNIYFPLYPRKDAFEEIGEVWFDEGGDLVYLWNVETNDGDTTSINITGTWNGNTTNLNYDDRPLVAMIHGFNLIGDQFSVLEEDNDPLVEEDSDYLLLESAINSEFTIDGIVKATSTKTFTADAMISAASTKTFTVDAIINSLVSLTKTFTVDGVVLEARTVTFTLDGIISTRTTKTFTTDGYIRQKIKFLQATADTSDAAEYTFASQNLGVVDSNRYIIVTIGSRKSGGATTITGVTIGGVAATIVRQKAIASGTTNIVGIAIAKVPTGTTGSIVVTFGATMVRCAIGIYHATGIVPGAFDSDESVLADPAVTLDIPAGGFAIGIGINAPTTTTWTGLVEDFDSVVESFVSITGAHDEFPARQTELPIMADFASSGESGAVFASWGAGTEFTADGIVIELSGKTFTVDGIVKTVLSKTFTVDGLVYLAANCRNMVGDQNIASFEKPEGGDQQIPEGWTVFNSFGSPTYKGTSFEEATDGHQSFKIAATTNVDTGLKRTFTFQPGTVITASIHVKTDSLISNACIVFNDLSTGAGGGNGTALGANNDQRISVTRTVPANGQITLFIGVGAFGATSAGTAHFDALMINIGASAFDYCPASVEFTVDGIIAGNASFAYLTMDGIIAATGEFGLLYGYVLNGIRLKSAQDLRRIPIYQKTDVTSITGKTMRDVSHFKEKYLLRMEYLTKDEVDILQGLCNLGTSMRFTVNLRDQVFIDSMVFPYIGTIVYDTLGSDYLASLELELIEVE